MKYKLSFWIWGMLTFSFLTTLSAEDNLAEIKRSVLDSHYIFSSEISETTQTNQGVYEFPLGKKIFLTNRVLRERFQVAGKPITVFFSQPVVVESIAGLKFLDQKPSNSLVYQNLTDEKGEMVIAFIPPEGQLRMDVHFLTIPQNYTENIHNFDFMVFDSHKILLGFNTLPLVWAGLFFFCFCIRFIHFVGIRLPINIDWTMRFSAFHPILKNILEISNLFPYFFIRGSFSGKQIFIRQASLIIMAVMISFLLQRAPVLLWIGIILSMVLFHYRVLPFLILGIILPLDLFLKDFYSIQSLSQHIDYQNIIYIILLTLLATSPSLSAGIIATALFRYWNDIQDVFSIYSIFNNQFLIREYFYLFLLSLTLTGFVIGYRLWFDFISHDKLDTRENTSSLKNTGKDSDFAPKKYKKGDKVS